jgi:hypothetical protein
MKSKNKWLQLCREEIGLFEIFNTFSLKNKLFTDAQLKIAPS